MTTGRMRMHRERFSILSSITGCAPALATATSTNLEQHPADQLIGLQQLCREAVPSQVFEDVASSVHRLRLQHTQNGRRD